MSTHPETGLSNITVAEIEAGVRRGRQLRSRYYHDLGLRFAAALRRAMRPTRAAHHVHATPIAHGC